MIYEGVTCVGKGALASKWVRACKSSIKGNLSLIFVSERNYNCRNNTNMLLRVRLDNLLSKLFMGRDQNEFLYHGKLCKGQYR